MRWNKGRLCWKIVKLFYFCHLKKSWSGRKLLDPTTYMNIELYLAYFCSNNEISYCMKIIRCLWEMEHPRNQGRKHPAVQIALSIKFLRYGTCCLSPFWHLQFWGDCWISGKFLQLCHKQYLCHLKCTTTSMTKIWHQVQWDKQTISNQFLL